LAFKFASNAASPSLAFTSAATNESATCAERSPSLVVFKVFRADLYVSLVALKLFRAAASALRAAGVAFTASFTLAAEIFARVAANFLPCTASLVCAVATTAAALYAAVSLIAFLAGAFFTIFFLAGFFNLILRDLASYAFINDVYLICDFF